MSISIEYKGSSGTHKTIQLRKIEIRIKGRYHFMSCVSFNVGSYVNNNKS